MLIGGLIIILGTALTVGLLPLKKVDNLAT
jgi:hypothetical protein